MKKLLLFLAISAITVSAQNNITNTVGTGGTFKVKDAANTFMTIEQSTGNVGLSKDPAYKLDVNGDLNITGNYKINGTNISTGESFIQTYTISSTNNSGNGTYYLSGTGASVTEKDNMKLIPITGTTIKLYAIMSGAISTSYTLTVRRASQATGSLTFSNTAATITVDAAHQYRSISIAQNFSAGDVFTIQLVGTQTFATTTESIAVSVVFQ